MKIPNNFSVNRARLAQRKISKLIVRRDVLPSKISVVGGVDVTYLHDLAIGTIVCLRFRDMKLIDRAFSIVKVRFPYVPTLLAFREIAPVVAAYKLLKIKPDVILVDGQGLIHPYRAGFACHLGVVLRKPTIGVAKKLLCGHILTWRENIAYIEDRAEIIGVALKLKSSWKPIYISIGNMVSLDTAIRIVRRTIIHGKLPEPIRVAHNLANDIRRELSEEFKDFLNNL